MPGFNIPISDKCGSFGVITGPSNTTETARKHRYVLETLEPFGTKDNGLLLFAYKCTRPSIELDEVAIHNAQDEIFRPGKQHWKPIEFSFYEKLKGASVQSDHAAELVYQWWAKTMINVETSLHNEPSSYLKNAQLDMLDGDGNAVWTYSIYDAWPVKVTPSDLSYTDTDIADISVTLRYAKAREKQGKATTTQQTSKTSSS